MIFKKAAVILFLIMVFSYLPGKAETAKEWIDKGNSLFGLASYEEAIKCYDRVLKIDAKNIEALCGICQSLLFQNKDTEGIKYFVKIVKTDHQNSLISGSIFPLMDQLGKYEVMFEACEKALELYPKNMDFWYYKCYALENMGDFDEVITCCDKLLAAEPENKDIISYKLFILERQGKFDEILKYCDNALVSEPKDIEYLSYKVYILDQKGNSEELVKCCDKILEIDPQNSQAFYYKGNSLNKQKKYEEAVRCFDKALEYLCKDT
jgi:tetratricopeptide (TPR) repeat protein